MFGKKKKTQKALGELFEGLQERPWLLDAFEGNDEAAREKLGLYLGEIDKFVAAGLDLDTPEPKSKTTLLEYACWAGELAVVKHLVASHSNKGRTTFFGSICPLCLCWKPL